MPSKTFAGQFTSLAAIADFIAQAAQEAGFNSKDTYAVKLAVDEACSNIIEHGYHEHEGSKIRCSYAILKDGLKITIQDWGEPFAPGHELPVKITEVGHRSAKAGEPELQENEQDRKKGSAARRLVRRLSRRRFF